MITLIFLIKTTKLNLIQKNRNLITCYPTCDDCYGEKYNDCKICKYTLTLTIYDTCDCGDNVLYKTDGCINDIKCPQNYKVTQTGLCSTSEGDSCTNEQILYKCFNVKSDDFPNQMMELLIIILFIMVLNIIIQFKSQVDLYILI